MHAVCVRACVSLFSCGCDASKLMRWGCAQHTDEARTANADMPYAGSLVMWYVTLYCITLCYASELFRFGLALASS